MAAELELSPALVSAFARATGDHSAIHVDPEFARKTQFREPIVHGMLPVVLLLGRMHDQQRRPGRLCEIKCRFQRPLKIGERVSLDARLQSQTDARASWSFEVRRASDGAVATSGACVLVYSDGAEPVRRSRASLLAEDVQQASYSLADARTGMTERITLQVPGLSSFLREASTTEPAGAAFSNTDDDATSMLAAISTLVGMRLPGRYATFSEFSAMLATEVSPDLAVVLEGRVRDIRPSGRMEIDLSWTQQGRTVGTGNASTLIGAPPPAAIACSEIVASHMDLGIRGRTALITGSSRGIGEAIAKLLAMNGARVAVHYFQGHQDAAAVVDDIARNGGGAVAVRADLRKRDHVAAMFSQVRAALGPVDILVNNAVGSFSTKPVEEVTSDDYLDELSISLFGMHACCAAALPHMRSQRWGKIINIGTVATEVPALNQNRYTTAKSAIVGYTRSLAVDTAADNIQVNIVAPAMTATTLIAGLPAALVRRLAEESPDGSLLAPVNVAKAVLFLASGWASCISGQQLLLTRGAPPFL